MRIVVNHLTRMEKGYFCGAGIDLETGRHVRPVLAAGKRCRLNLLSCNGGPFGMANVVEFGNIKPFSNPPEVEDHVFDPKAVKILNTLHPIGFWKELNKAAKYKLSDIFGKDLKKEGTGSATVDRKKGNASLGCFIPTTYAKMYLRPAKDEPPKIRMKLNDGDFIVDVSVTDLRLYNEDYTPNRQLVRKIAGRLENCAGVVLGVGLTRPFAKDKNQTPVHWLQVNNIHLLENPVW